jgi:hypothetical protein
VAISLSFYRITYSPPPLGALSGIVVRALGVEDVIQCPFASVGCTSGSSDGWSGGMYLLMRPLLLALVKLLVRVASWCRWCGFRSSDEVLGSLVGDDVEVCLSKQLFRGGRRFLQYGSNEGRVIGSSVEIFNHRYLGDFGDAISHGLRPLEV